MKIAIACERFDSNAGGLEHWACQLVRALERRGHEMHVVTFRAAPAEADARTRLHVLPWSDSRLSRAGAVHRALAGLNADVSHDLGVCWTADVLHPQAGSGIANRRRDWVSRNLRERAQQRLRPSYWNWLFDVREFERRQYGRAGAIVIAVSRMVAGHLQKLHGVPVERIRVVPNGVDTERFSPLAVAPLRDGMRRRLNIHAGQTLFLFAAHNPRLKGIRPLLQALAELRRNQPAALLAIIGKDPEPEHRRAAIRLRLDDAVRFEGFVDDPLPYYAAADAFVLPSFYDACSLTVLEACACGLPVVTSQYNGVAELLTHGREGFLDPRREGFVIEDPGNFAELAQAMTHCADPARRVSLSSAARDLALRNGMDRNVAALENVYLERLSRGSSGRQS